MRTAVSKNTQRSALDKWTRSALAPWQFDHCRAALLDPKYTCRLIEIDICRQICWIAKNQYLHCKHGFLKRPLIVFSLLEWRNLHKSVHAEQSDPDVSSTMEVPTEEEQFGYCNGKSYNDVARKVSSGSEIWTSIYQES